MTDTAAPDITIAIRCVNDSIPQFRECLDAIRAQQDVSWDLWIVDSSDHEQFAEICAAADDVNYIRIDGKNLCEGRNKGAELARSDYVVLTDPDCVPCPVWLRELKAQLDAGAAVTGGKVIARWLAKPPWYIRQSRIALAHLSLRDMGDTVQETDRVFGANMAFSKSALDASGAGARFREDLDRVDGILLGGGDTEFCERARANGGTITYAPAAVVEHQIPPRRLTFGWTLKRVFYGGVSRSFRGGRPNPVKSGDAPAFAFADLFFMAVFGAPYVAGQLYGKRLKKTKGIQRIGNPEWNNAVDEGA